MVAENDQPSIPARRLAERLRDLREQEHLTQKQLARILGGPDALSIATISLWEKPGSGRCLRRRGSRRTLACSAPADRLTATGPVCSVPVS